MNNQTCCLPKYWLIKQKGLNNFHIVMLDYFLTLIISERDKLLKLKESWSADKFIMVNYDILKNDLGLHADYKSSIIGGHYSKLVKLGILCRKEIKTLNGTVIEFQLLDNDLKTFVQCYKGPCFDRTNPIVEQVNNKLGKSLTDRVKDGETNTNELHKRTDMPHNVPASIVSECLSNINLPRKNVKAGNEGVICTDKNGVVRTDQNSEVCTDQNSVVCTGQNGVVCTDQNGVVCTDQNGVVCTDQNGVVCTDQNGVVCTSKNSEVSTCKNDEVCTSQNDEVHTSQEDKLKAVQQNDKADTIRFSSSSSFSSPSSPTTPTIYKKAAAALIHSDRGEIKLTAKDIEKKCLSLSKTLKLDQEFYRRASDFLIKQGIGEDYITWVYKECVNKKPIRFPGMFITLFFKEDVFFRFEASLLEVKEETVKTTTICPVCEAVVESKYGCCHVCSFPMDKNNDNDLIFVKKWERSLPEAIFREYQQKCTVLLKSQGEGGIRDDKMAELRRQYGYTR